MLKLSALLFLLIDKCLSCTYIYPYHFAPTWPILGTDLASEGGVCVVPQVFSGKTPTDTILDFSWYCSSDGSVTDLLDCDLTTSKLPFNVTENEISDFENCHTILTMDKLTLRMCSWNFSVKDDLINFELNWNPEVSIKSRSSTAFLIRITDWMSELHEYRMMFMLEMMSTFEIQIVESDRPIWLALFFADNGLHFLKNIQSVGKDLNKIDKRFFVTTANPTNPNCSYNFLVIGPPGKDADGDYPYYGERAYLLNISESEPFVEQFLEVQYYSLEIPVKCAPKIVLNATDKKGPDWYEEKQELCDGTAIVTSQAYYDASHTPDAAYVLNRNIFCNEESIDVIVELIGILDDLPLNITCYDSERNIVNFNQVRRDPIDGYTFWGISSIQFDWKWSTYCPYERFGMAVKVSVSRVSERVLTTTPEETTTELITTVYDDFTAKRRTTKVTVTAITSTTKDSSNPESTKTNSGSDFKWFLPTVASFVLLIFIL